MVTLKFAEKVVALTLERLGRKPESATAICAFQSERADMSRWQQTSEPNSVQRKFSVLSKLIATHQKCLVLKESDSSHSLDSQTRTPPSALSFMWPREGAPRMLITAPNSW